MTILPLILNYTRNPGPPVCKSGIVHGINNDKNKQREQETGIKTETTKNTENTKTRQKY